MQFDVLGGEPVDRHVPRFGRFDSGEGGEGGDEVVDGGTDRRVEHAQITANGSAYTLSTATNPRLASEPALAHTIDGAEPRSQPSGTVIMISNGSTHVTT